MTKRLEDIFVGTLELTASELACFRHAVTEHYMNGGRVPAGENPRDFTERLLGKLCAFKLARMVTPDGARLVPVGTEMP